MTINAVYEQGVFKPTTAIELKEGTQVEVLIKEEIAGPDPREAAHLLEEIARMPMQNPGAFSGRDHDAVLYGKGYGK